MMKFILRAICSHQCRQLSPDGFHFVDPCRHSEGVQAQVEVVQHQEHLLRLHTLTHGREALDVRKEQSDLEAGSMLTYVMQHVRLMGAHALIV